jgi:hypothetical protein
MTIGHWAGTRGPGAAEYKLEIAEGDLTKRREVLVIQLEPKLLSIESDGATNVFDLISNPPKPTDQALRFFCG